MTEKKPEKLSKIIPLVTGLVSLMLILGAAVAPSVSEAIVSGGTGAVFAIATLGISRLT